MNKKKLIAIAGITSMGAIGISLSILMANLSKIIVDLEDFDEMYFSDF